MTLPLAAILLVSCVCAAAGQTFFKIGVSGRASVLDAINPMIAIGFFGYGVGTLLWLYALSKAPLYAVYPFTLLTFVFVGVASVVFLGEKLSVLSVIGAVVVVAGVALMALGSILRS